MAATTTEGMTEAAIATAIVEATVMAIAIASTAVEMIGEEEVR